MSGPRTTQGDRTRHKTKHPGIYRRGDERHPRYIVWFKCSGCRETGGCPGHTETLPEGTTLKDAVARRGELMSKVAGGERIVRNRLTFSDVAERYVEQASVHWTPNTERQYESVLRVHLRPRFGQRKVGDISTDDVASFIAELQRKGAKANTINAIVKVLSNVLKFAVRRGWCGQNPVSGLLRTEKPKRDQEKMRILSTSEVERLLEHAPAKGRPLLATLVFTGLRIGEALALRWSQVDFDRGIVTVGQSKTKAGEGREVILIPALAKLLREHKLASPPTQDVDPLVFATSVGTAVDRSHVQRFWWTPTLEAAGLGHLRLHDLRHTFASILIGQGEDVTFVADQLGHSNPAITLSIYAKLFDPKRRRDEARERLQAAMGGVL